MSSHLQVQGGIKMTYEETPALLLLLLPFPYLAEQVTPLPSIKLFYLTPSKSSAWILPLGMQGVRSSKNSMLITVGVQVPHSASVGTLGERITLALQDKGGSTGSSP
jgi:hypothetical protein